MEVTMKIVALLVSLMFAAVVHAEGGAAAPAAPAAEMKKEEAPKAEMKKEEGKKAKKKKKHGEEKH